MPRFIVKHEMVPPAWAHFSEGGDKVSFGPRERATEFPDAKSAMDAFEAASAAMWKAALAAEAKREKASAAKAAQALEALQALRSQGLFPSGGSRGQAKPMAPSWLMKKNGRSTSYWGGATGVFEVEAKALDSDASAAFELFYARSELGWLGGPRTKSDWGSMSWRSDISEAKAFVGSEGLEAALRQAPPARGVSRLKAKAVFVEADLAEEPDEVALAVAAGCQAREIDAELEPKAEKKAKALGAARI